MSSTSAIPPSHVPSASLQKDHPTVEWPALSPNTPSNNDNVVSVVENDWELLTEATDESNPVFSNPSTSNNNNNNNNHTVRIVEPEMEAKTTRINRRILKHCESSPDLRQYVLEETSSSEDNDEEEEDEEASGVLVENTADDVTSLASSSVVMVSSGPSSATSPWSSKLSFKEAILKSNPEGSNSLHQQQPHKRHHHHHTRIRKLKKPVFVVKPIKRCSKSTGDLTSLDNDTEEEYGSGGGGGGGGGCQEQILGDTDAQQYYSQKAQGKLGRKNGKKIRPDEAKRLEITMAKKTMQRETAAAAGGGKKKKR